VRAQAHNVYYIIQIITVYATALLICNHIMTQNPQRGRGGTGKTLWDSPLEETSEEK